MKRLNFTQENWLKSLAGNKTVTRRCHDEARYAVGDVVILTEPTQIVEFDVPYGFCLLYPWDGKRVWFHESEITNADYSKINKWKNAYKRQPPMFMLSSFARHYVEIVAVKCEPLQNITYEECMAEGVSDLYPDDIKFEDGWRSAPRHNFVRLWDGINGTKQGRRWADNPEVFAYTYRYLEGYKP